MPIKVIITKDFDHMSKVAAGMVKEKIINKLKKKKNLF